MVNGKALRSKRRGEYFHKLRLERCSLKSLTKVKPDFTKKAEVRNLRQVYYCILPRLFSLLWYGPDRDLLFQVEQIYYDWVNTSRLVNGIRVSANRLNCRFYQSIY